MNLNAYLAIESVEQHGVTSLENFVATLRKCIGIKKLTISSDYIVYLE